MPDQKTPRFPLSGRFGSLPGRPGRGFTIVELMMAAGILAVFLFFVYKLFLGGTRSANKAQWINNAVEQLRNTTNYISSQLKSTSYPTTLLSNVIQDPSDNETQPAIAQAYYVKILKNGQKMEAPSGITKLKLMEWTVSQPERPPSSPGRMTKFALNFHPKDVAFANGVNSRVGDLRVEQEEFTYISNPKNQYARGGVVENAVNGSKKELGLINDVEWVQFDVDPLSTLPTPPTDFRYINIKIHCRFPKDPNTFKDNSIMITPNVGIKLF
jgi:prepilin-type N-terminal cleavage/methylation domain-containing protein